MAISKRVVLQFPTRLIDQPIIYRLVKDYDLVLNILKASVTPNEEGLMVLELSGARASYDRGIKYLQDTGVRIQSLGQDIMRNDVRCTHGATVGQVDDDHLYYLMSRGIARADAEKLLIFGFFNEVLDRVEWSGMHELLAGAILGKLESGS